MQINKVFVLPKINLCPPSHAILALGRHNILKSFVKLRIIVAANDWGGVKQAIIAEGRRSIKKLRTAGI